MFLNDNNFKIIILDKLKIPLPQHPAHPEQHYLFINAEFDILLLSSSTLQNLPSVLHRNSYSYLRYLLRFEYLLRFHVQTSLAASKWYRKVLNKLHHSTGSCDFPSSLHCEEKNPFFTFISAMNRTKYCPFSFLFFS